VGERAARNLMISGGVGHPFETTSGHLSDLLAAEGITSEITTDVNGALEALGDGGGVELVTVNALRWRMTADRYAPLRAEWAFELSVAARRAVVDHVAAGRGLLGVHTASICFDDWPGWGTILGGAWNWDRSHHPPLGPTTVVVVDPDDDLTRGLSDFATVDEVYGFLDVEPDVEPLLSAAHGGVDHPVLWRRRVGPGRVVYDALGHDGQGYASPAHREVVRRAARWAAFGA
jgi:type 1 glutamine amidotransferase